MKNVFKILVLLFILLFTFGCANTQKENNDNNGKEDPTTVEEDPNKDSDPTIDKDDKDDKEDKEEDLVKQKDIIFKWLEDTYTDYVIDKDFLLPVKHPDYDLEIEFYDFDHFLGDDGKYTAPILDYESEILFVIVIDKVEYELFLPVLYKGYGDEFDVINYELSSSMPKVVASNIQLRDKVNGHDATLSWKSKNPEIIEDDGTIHKLMTQNQTCVLTCTITIGGESRSFDYTVTVNKVSDAERIGYAKEWLEANFNLISNVSSDIDLPTYLEEYDANFIWNSSNPTILSGKGIYKAPFHDEDVVLTVNVRVGVKSEALSYSVKVIGLNNTDMWDKIESFLDFINIKEIKTQRFTLYGCEEGYYNVPTQNIGYLPFYDEAEMVIIEDYLPRGSGLKPDQYRSSTQYIVVHNTGMAAPTATAKGLNEYIHTTDRVASWHFSIDDHETYQHVPIGEIAWHAGDGSHVFGETWSGGIGGGNQNGVAIETCVYSGIDFNKCMRRLAKLVAMLLIRYNLGIDRVKQHWDFSGKDCPQVIRHAERWNELLDLIRLEMFAQTELQGVHFEWVSLSPEIMDDTGAVINHPGDSVEVSYKVIVTYDGVTKEYTYTSTLLEFK